MTISDKESQDEVRLWRMPTLGAKASSNQTSLGAIAGHRGHLTAEGLQSIREEARKEGFQQGLEEGRQSGEQKARNEVAKKNEALLMEYRQQFESIFTALQKPLNDRDDETEQALAELAISIAKQVIRRELRTNPGEIVAVVREAIGLLPINQQAIRIRLHPEDAAFIRKVFMMDGGEQREWKISEDPSLQRGGCKVSTEDSAIDATIESRIASIVAHILGGDRANDSDDTPTV